MSIEGNVALAIASNDVDLHVKNLDIGTSLQATGWQLEGMNLHPKIIYTLKLVKDIRKVYFVLIRPNGTILLWLLVPRIIR